MDFQSVQKAKVMALKNPLFKSAKAHSEPFSHTSGTNGGQQLHLKEQLVCRMLVQRLGTVVKIGNCQRRYDTVTSHQ